LVLQFPNNLSQAAETASRGIEIDLARRLFIGGFAGALSLFTKSSLADQISSTRATTVSPDGVIRMTLENHVNEQTGEEFKLLLNTYPPGVGLPSHHHPSVAHNYVLEGVAESQYSGEDLMTLRAGESYQDKAGRQHLVFRNPDRTAPLKYLIAYTVKKGEPFLIIP
jgi:quercetin dioxygenase-like cupin family protein